VNTALPRGKEREWLTLGAASRFLGVDGSTLRAWTDAGRIQAFRTPGGHRRYAREHLEAFVRQGQAGRGGRVADVIGPHGARLMAGASRRELRQQQWYATLDPKATEAMRLTCRKLMDALAGYVAGGRKQTGYLREGGAAGNELGAGVAALRLSPSQATQAFLYFKESIADAVSSRLPLSPDDKVRSMRRVDQFLDHVLVRMMAAYEERTSVC
jgi:excisionase family DNA binding protein